MDGQAQRAALQDFIHAHRHLFVLTGAGCSTESGIPAYRDDDGQWQRAQPVTFQAFVGDAATRRRYWARSLVGWPLFGNARPNAAHTALARLESAGRLRLLVTQNVDRLHQAAGSRAVVDLHGRLDLVGCMQCGQRITRASLQTRLEASNSDWSMACAGRSGMPVRQAPDGDADIDPEALSTFVVPVCNRCGGMLKPDVVFFGEAVPRPRIEETNAALRDSDAMLVVGSSLMVPSGFRLVRDAHARGIPIAAVNLGRTRADPLLTLKVIGGCADWLGSMEFGGCRAGAEADKC